MRALAQLADTSGDIGLTSSDAHLCVVGGNLFLHLAIGLCRKADDVHRRSLSLSKPESLLYEPQPIEEYAKSQQ